MAVNKIALAPLENLETPGLQIAPYTKAKTKSSKYAPTTTTKKTGVSTGFTAADPVKEAKIATENATAAYGLPNVGKVDGVDYSYISQLNQLDLNWSNPEHRSRLLEIQRGAEWDGKGSGVSTAGAAGPAQFMPATWNEMKQLGVVPKHASRFDKKWAMVAQEYYMDSLYKSKAVQSASTEVDKTKRMLAAYNAGIGSLGDAVEKARSLKDENKWYMHLPKVQETIPYMTKILKKFKEDKQPLTMMRKLGGILYKQ